MRNDSNIIFERYKNITEQKNTNIGGQAVDIKAIVNAIDNSNDLSLEIKNSLKTILMSKINASQVSPMPTPSAMTQTPVTQQ